MIILNAGKRSKSQNLSRELFRLLTRLKKLITVIYGQLGPNNLIAINLNLETTGINQEWYLWHTLFLKSQKTN